MERRTNACRKSRNAIPQRAEPSADVRRLSGFRKSSLRFGESPFHNVRLSADNVSMAIIYRYVHLHNVSNLADEILKSADDFLKLENVVLKPQNIVG